jgi:hypothetical protein
VIRELKDIESSGRPGEPIYFIFSKLPIEHTEAHADGEVNVDVDHYNEVVGIELLSGKPENFAVFFEIVKHRALSLTGIDLVPRRGG